MWWRRIGLWMGVAVGLWLVCGCTPEAGTRPSNPEETLLEELAGQLNPEVPGLRGFFAAWEEGEPERAKEELLAYFRLKPVPQVALPSAIDRGHPTLAAAVDGLRGIFLLQGSKGSARKGDGTINWGAGGPKEDREWTWMLNRHSFFRQFLVAYEEQNNPSFAEAIDRMLLDWFWKHPPPEGIRFSAAWRALEAARRMTDSWLPVYESLRGDPILSNEALLAILAGAARHAEYLRDYHHFGGNHLVTEMTALATIAVVWDEFRDAPDWLRYAVKTSLGELQDQTYPDGAHKELANHYQWVAGSSFQRIYDLLVEAGMDDAVQLMRPRLEAMWEYYAGVVRPDGTGPLNNDSDLEPNAEQLLPLAEIYERPDWLFTATAGEAGERPEGKPSRYYPWAGHVIFRSGWDRTADWAFFDIGPYGSDHQQKDRLHLSVALGGVDLLVDSGRYVYRDDAWSRFFRSPQAHNVPTFGGYDQVTPDPESAAPQMNTVAFGRDLNLAWGRVPLVRQGRFGWGAFHERAVVTGDGWVWITDRVSLDAPDMVTFRWRFHPDVVPSDLPEEDGTLLLRNEGVSVARWVTGDSIGEEAMVRVHGETKPRIQGWYSPQYNTREPNVVLEYPVPLSGMRTFSWLLIREERYREGMDLELTETPQGSRLVLNSSNGERRIREVRLGPDLPMDSGAVLLQTNSAVLLERGGSQ